MLLVTVDKSFEFDCIYIDQQLNLVFESCAILHGVPPNSSMVFTLSIDIILFWIWRSPRPCGNSRNPIILNQYGEQLCIRHWKRMVHFSPFSFPALVIAWVRPLIVILCKLSRRLKTGKGTWAYLGERGWFLTGFSHVVCDLLFSPNIAWTCSSRTNLFFSLVLAPMSTILPFFIPSSILHTEYIKSPNSTKVLTISMS